MFKLGIEWHPGGVEVKLNAEQLVSLASRYSWTEDGYKPSSSHLCGIFREELSSRRIWK